jgi:hypothetical protein
VCVIIRLDDDARRAIDDDDDDDDDNETDGLMIAIVRLAMTP